MGFQEIAEDALTALKKHNDDHAEYVRIASALIAKQDELIAKQDALIASLKCEVSLAQMIIATLKSQMIVKGKQ